jgi:hypothetical protein
MREATMWIVQLALRRTYTLVPIVRIRVSSDTLTEQQIVVLDPDF